MGLIANVGEAFRVTLFGLNEKEKKEQDRIARDIKNGTHGEHAFKWVNNFTSILPAPKMSDEQKKKELLKGENGERIRAALRKQKNQDITDVVNDFSRSTGIPTVFLLVGGFLLLVGIMK